MSARQSTCARSSASTRSKPRSRRRSRAPRPWRSSSVSAPPALRSPPSASSCSPREKASAPGAGACGAARLDRLGGASWQRVKESVRAALREMAEGLLRLYAQRAVADGHAFAADTPWQREFEAAFRFEETADQLKAIEDAKHDMEAG